MSARTTRWPPPLLAVAVAALLTACGDTVSDAPAFTRYDSAGVEIVQSSGPAWSADDAWTIDSVPRVSIGRLEGDPRYLFGDVMGAVRVGDRIVVADGQALELRFFDLDGIHVQTVGREGDGPGELNSILELWRCAGDEIRVLDFRDQAVLVHTPDGDFVEEVRVLEPSAERSRRPYALACSPNGGGYVGVGWGDGPDEGEEGEVLRAEAPAWLFDDQGDVVLDLGMHLLSRTRPAPGRGRARRHRAGLGARDQRGRARGRAGPPLRPSVGHVWTVFRDELGIPSIHRHPLPF